MANPQYGDRNFNLGKAAPAQMFVQNSSGTFEPITKSDFNLSLANSSLVSAFGENASVQNYALIQSMPANNLLPESFGAFTANGGAAGVENKEFKVSTNTTVGGYGALQSVQSVNYRPGLGAMGRFTARFASGGVANSWQGAGFLNLGDELSFGYSGTTFGCWYRHNGLAEVRKLNMAVGAGGSENATVYINGGSWDIPLTNVDTSGNAYEIADYLFTGTGTSAFDVWQNGSGVYISYRSDGSKTGVYSFSSATASGDWSQITQGETKTSEFIPQTSWNIDTKSGLDPTKGNVYQVKYQYLGYGAIEYSLENPETSLFEPVHVIKYANNNDRPSLGNSSMHMGMYAVSLGSTTNLDVFSASMAGFIQGLVHPTRNPRSFSNVKSLGTTFTNLFTIRNKRALNGFVNQIEIELKHLTLFTESVKGATIEIRKNATVAGPTNFQDVGDNLISEYDTSGGEVSSDGNLLLSFVVPKDAAESVNLDNLRIRIYPFQSITVSAKVNSGADAEVGAALVWYEDI